MSRSVLAVERSPLARNVYQMILSALDEVEVKEGGASDQITSLEKLASDCDLVILGGSTIVDRKKDFLNLAKLFTSERKLLFILLVNEGAENSWSDLASVPNVKMIAKPFLPDELLNLVKEIW